MSRRFATLLFLTGLWGFAACRPAPPPDMLFIMIDTLRADRLGAYGNQRGLTPFLDSLAERGYVFRNAYAQSSWTNPSIASLLTSRFQSQHGIVGYESVLAANELTLPELLQERGYTTAGFSANGLISERNGFAQGYDEYRASFPEPAEGSTMLWVPKRAKSINQEGLSWLDTLPGQRQAPVFLYLHYMEPHIPYAPPESMLEQAFEGRELPDIEKVNTSMLLGNLARVDAEMVRIIQEVYDIEVMSLDAQLRELFKALESRGFLDNAIVVIVADHGEEFMDHGLMGHDQTLYNEVIRVPFIMLVPGQSKRVDIDEPVALIDVAPTLLDWAGANLPATFEGRSRRKTMQPNDGWLQSVWRLFQQGDTSTSPIFSELLKQGDKEEERQTPHERAIIVESQKLIAGTGGESEFYHLATDPREKESGSLSQAERASLQARLVEFREHAARKVSPQETRPLDEEAKERLRALGYGK